MGKIANLPQALNFDEGDVLVKDGENGTKQIPVSEAAKYMGRDTIMVNEQPTEGTKVVIQTTDQEYSLALMSDVDAVDDKVEEVKTRLNELEELTTEEIETRTSTDMSDSSLSTGVFVMTNGNRGTNADYNCFENVSVTPGEDYSTTFMFRFVTAYKNGVVDSTAGAQNTQTYTVPADVTTVSFTTYSDKAQTLIKTVTGTERVNILDDDISALNVETERLNAGVFQSTTDNLVNPSANTTGIISSQGIVDVSNTAYFTTDFIFVPSGETIKFTTARRYLSFNADKTPDSYVTDESNTFTASGGDKYIRISGYANTEKYFMCNYGTSLKPYAPYTKNKSLIRKELYIFAEDGMDNFYTKMKKAYNEKNYDVYIKRGTYTYTNAFIEQIRTEGKRGVPIGGNCRYFFETGARIYCEYTGANASDVVTYFSPLDVLNTSEFFEIYNLDITAKNCCYALHDDSAGSVVFNRHIYKDCYLVLDNSALGSSGNQISKALGGGLGAYQEIIIENCVFNSTNPLGDGEDASYHGAANQTFSDAKVVVDGCYFENTFRASFAYGTDVLRPKIIFTNNSTKTAVNLTNSDYHSWNNEIRGS